MTAVVAIDGPGGAGKSTVSRLVAERIGAVHLDTGALYRAATLAVLAAGVDPDDEMGVATVVADCVVDQHQGRTFLNGADVTGAIRSESVTRAVSAVSAVPEVRRQLVEAQRRWVDRHRGPAVVEGRDIGTVVFPEAALKVFLDADPDVRAERRSGETGGTRSSVAEALSLRDTFDSTRATSPLRAAAEAVHIDTTHLTLDEVVDRVLRLLEQVEIG